MASNSKVEEALSALMDGETTELEIRQVLRDMAGNDELRGNWQRYQLASAAMKRDLPPRFSDLSASISAAIEQESAVRNPSKVFGALGKVAIAASVAIVAVVGANQLQWLMPAGNDVQVANVAGAETGNAQFQLPAGYDLPPVAARTVSAGGQPQYSRPTVLVSPRPVADLADEQAVRDYFNTMMEQHTEHAAHSLSSQGLLPFARLSQDEDNGR